MDTLLSSVNSWININLDLLWKGEEINIGLEMNRKILDKNELRYMLNFFLV